MDKQINELNEKFLNIKNQGWIKSLRKGTSGIGYTFEKLIGKEEENFPIPDYKNIEIKTSCTSSWGRIHLFHATPDGEYLFPIKSILDVLGYPDKDFPKHNVFNFTLNAKNYTPIGKNKKAIILVDHRNEKLFLIAKNMKNEKLDLYISWSFDMLKQRLNLKLIYLAVIKADSKISGDIKYFKYNKITFYKLKSFDTFIKLIELGIIEITFGIGLYKSGKRFGQIHDRGTSFSIREKKIEYLYEKINIL